MTDNCPYLTEFLENYEQLKPEHQEYFRRLIPEMVKCVKANPEMARLSPGELVLTITREIAPDRPELIAAAERMAEGVS